MCSSDWIMFQPPRVHFSPILLQHAFLNALRTRKPTCTSSRHLCLKRVLWVVSKLCVLKQVDLAHGHWWLLVGNSDQQDPDQQQHSKILSSAREAAGVTVVGKKSQATVLQVVSVHLSHFPCSNSFDYFTLKLKISSIFLPIFQTICWVKRIMESP